MAVKKLLTRTVKNPFLSSRTIARYRRKSQEEIEKTERSTVTEKRIKVYTYTRVSTAMQIDGYSLDAQKARMKAFADFNGYEIVREYEDAGKSGRSIEGRLQFQQMMQDIRDDRDGASYVLVYKLSRFGRNAADVLNSLQMMQDFGVNLICVEDGIDSSKDAGKLIISVLSAVAEIEKDNIRVQTMEGRMQKAREGRWNGGQAPYGYRLTDGELLINEEEAKAVRIIYTSGFQTGATYDELQAWVQANYGFHVIHLNIAQVKRKHGLDMRENYNLPKSEESRQPNCPEEKVKAIENALKHFQMI